MFAKTFIASSLAAIALAAPNLFPFIPLPCSAISGTPCVCPAGTTYSESVSTALVGARASDVGHAVNDFFNPLWTGVTEFTVQGPDNTPGLSIRNLNFTTPIGSYIFSQRLDFRFIWPDGSFEQRLSQRGVIPYRSGNGSFSGFWETIKGDRIFDNQTSLRISTYSCQTGHPIDIAADNARSLDNVTRILTASGLLFGISSPAVSAQLF